MKKYTFRKEERLCNKTFIDGLFHKGSSFVLYPFRIIFVKPELPLQEGESKIQVLISVPKRRIKKASDRNLIKRRIREAYRLQKAELLSTFFEQVNQPVYFAIQYLPNEILEFDIISEKLADALRKLCSEYAGLYLGEID